MTAADVSKLSRSRTAIRSTRCWNIDRRMLPHSPTPFDAYRDHLILLSLAAWRPPPFKRRACVSVTWRTSATRRGVWHRNTAAPWRLPSPRLEPQWRHSANAASQLPRADTRSPAHRQLTAVLSNRISCVQPHWLLRWEPWLRLFCDVDAAGHLYLEWWFEVNQTELSSDVLNVSDEFRNCAISAHRMCSFCWSPRANRRLFHRRCGSMIAETMTGWQGMVRWNYIVCCAYDFQNSDSQYRSSVR
jgi:hypothetical protein